MKEEIKEVLTKGLVGGYAGNSSPERITRKTFPGKSVHSNPDAKSTYSDEWFVPTHKGGGQELIKIEEEMFTRVYAGGTPSPEKLEKLGVTVKEVGKYLKEKIVELGDKTRLDEDCSPEADGDWQYQYEILLTDSDIGVVVAAESITYKRERVHLHPFILSPVV